MAPPAICYKCKKPLPAAKPGTKHFKTCGPCRNHARRAVAARREKKRMGHRGKQETLGRGSVEEESVPKQLMPTSLIAHDCVCSGCEKAHFEGPRYHCGLCDDFDLCMVCYDTEVHDLSHPFLRSDRPWSLELRLAPRSTTAHDCFCDECGLRNFDGNRYRCRVCDDYDLCPQCYEGNKHDLTHEFLQIDHPRSSVPKLLAPRRPNTTSSLPDKRGVRSTRKPKPKDAKKTIQVNRPRAQTSREVAVTENGSRDGTDEDELEEMEAASATVSLADIMPVIVHPPRGGDGRQYTRAYRIR